MYREALINLHAVLPCSMVNGPGKRLVVFFQGCARACDGCFNPDTHPFDQRLLVAPSEVFERHLRKGAVEGITISGGEPFLQPRGLKELLRMSWGMGLSTVVYTGFDMKELIKAGPLKDCLRYTDVLVDGPYVKGLPEDTPLARGSTNQTFHFLTGRYSIEDLHLPGKAEISIGIDGVARGTGFSRVRCLEGCFA